MNKSEIEAGIKQIEQLLAELKDELNPPSRKEQVSPVIIRYVRPSSAFCNGPDNLGGITLAFVIDYSSRVVGVGYAITRDDENFCKQQGRELAKSRLLTGDGVAYDYNGDGEESLVFSLYKALMRADGASLPPQIRMLRDRLNEYFIRY